MNVDQVKESLAVKFQKDMIRFDVRKRFALENPETNEKTVADALVVAYNTNDQGWRNVAFYVFGDNGVKFIQTPYGGARALEGDVNEETLVALVVGMLGDIVPDTLTD